MQKVKMKSKKMFVWMIVFSMLFSFVLPVNQSVVFAFNEPTFADGYPKWEYDSGLDVYNLTVKAADKNGRMYYGIYDSNSQAPTSLNVIEYTGDGLSESGYISITTGEENSIEVDTANIQGKTLYIVLSDVDNTNWCQAVPTAFNPQEADPIGGDPDPVSYEITFNLNGGTGSVPDPMYIIDGHTFANLPSGAGMSKDGYEFIAWTTTVDVPETGVSDLYEPNADMTLYALWEAIPLPSWATEAANAEEGTDYENADGDYAINTEIGLAWLAGQVNGGEDFSGTQFLLKGDLDLSGKQWVPIGNVINMFKGSFDGGGHKISGLEIGTEQSPDNSYNAVGLFGKTDNAVMRNLIIEGNVYSDKVDSIIGILAGENYNSSIYNCGVSGSVHGGVGSYLGGIAGYGQETFIFNSYSTADVTGTNVGLAGGVVGQCDNDQVANVYASGDISVDSPGIGVGAVAGKIDFYAADNVFWNIDAIQSIGGQSRAPEEQKGAGSGQFSDDESFPKTAEALKAQATRDSLNTFVVADGSGNMFGSKLARWTVDAENNNQGFPILDYASLTAPTLNSNATLTSNTLTISDMTIYVPYGSSYTALKSALTIPSGADVKLMFSNWAAYASDRSKFNEVNDLDGTTIIDSSYKIVSISEDDSSIKKYDIVISTVGLSEGSLGVAGNTKITGLTSASKYKVTVGASSKYVKADGTLSASEADVANLTGTEITGLTNGTSYKVEAYTPTGSQPDYAITYNGTTFQVNTAGTYASLSLALAACTDDGVDDILTIKLGDVGTPLTLKEVSKFSPAINGLITATYSGNIQIQDDATITGNTIGLSIPNGVTATLKDLTITHTTSDNYFSAVYMNGTCTLNIQEGASITVTTSNGYGIFNDGAGTINMSGGTVSASATTPTGATNTGIYNDDTGTLNISGGTVSCNGTGEAYAVRNYKTLNVSGNANVSGVKYGIHNNGASTSVSITGGTIEATGAGGMGIYTSGGNLTMSDGLVRATENTATGATNGYGIYNSGTTTTISGGIVSCSGAGNNSAAIHQSNTTLLTISGTANISGVKYGIYVLSNKTSDLGALHVNGGTVSASGVAGAGGNAILNQSSGLITVAGGSVIASGTNGIAITNNSTGTLNMTGGTVEATYSGNTANYGLMNSYGGTVNISGGTLSSAGTNAAAATIQLWWFNAGPVSQVNLSGTAKAISVSSNTIKIQKVGTADKDVATVFGKTIYGDTLADLIIKGAVVNDKNEINATNYASATITASSISAGNVFIAWTSDSGRVTYINQVNGANLSVLTTGSNAAVTTLYLKAGVLPTVVTLSAGSLGNAGNGKITGLTAGSKYKVLVNAETQYVKADGTLSASEADVANLTGTEITGLTNGTSYKVEAYTPTPVYAVAFTNGQVSITRTESALIGLTVTGATVFDSFKFELRLEADAIPTRADMMALGDNNTFTGPQGMNTLQATLPKDTENLTPNTAYKLYILAKSGGNYQEEVTVISFITKQSAPAFGESKVTIADITDISATVNVDWEDNDGEILVMILPGGYTDEMIHENTTIWSWEQGLEGAFVTTDGKVSAIMTTDAGEDPLTANTSYKAVIIGFKDTVDHKGNSQATATIIPFTTLAEAPIVTNLANGSLGSSGNNKITGLASGIKYQVTIGNTIKYVKSDGTLSDSEAEVADLIGTELVNLTNGTTYKVELYSFSDSMAVSGAKSALDNSDFTYLNGDTGSNITQNFTLPLAGDNGTTITWVEKTDEGNNVNLTGGSATVTRPSSTTGDRIVTLTATVTKNGISETKDITVTVKALPAANNGGNSDRTTTPPANQDTVVVIVNGKSENAGTETKTTEEGKSVVTVEVNNEVIESKIEEAIKNNLVGDNNLIQVPVSDTKADIIKVELTGDIIKKLEENTFDLSIKRDDVEYLIPAEEFTISNVAKDLGVDEASLKDIKIEVKITKLDESVVAKYNEVAKMNGAELIFPPVEFEIVAKTTKTDGTTSNVEISKFSNYVERIMEIPAGVDPSKITTGIVFNPDGTYSHVPTEVFQKDGKWYSKLNSLTNSNYSVVWNPVTVKSVEHHWSKDAVNDMASRLVIFNVESFDPNKAITRADFAEYIVRALGLYRVGSTHENKFMDVSPSGDRTLAILIANEHGIVTGYPDGTFRPDQKITREEAMAMYQRAMKVTELVGTDNDRYQSYTDYKQVGSWATTYVQAVLSAHVFNGTTATTISPKANLTYAEAAQAIKNLLVESKLINK
jgi:hypothetical protein